MNFLRREVRQALHRKGICVASLNVRSLCPVTQPYSGDYAPPTRVASVLQLADLFVVAPVRAALYQNSQYGLDKHTVIRTV